MITCEKTMEVLKIGQLSEDVCVVDYIKNIYERVMEETCGECVICREGSVQVYKIIEDITEGKGESDDIALLNELGQIFKDNANCQMARNAAEGLLDSLENNLEVWEMHIKKKRCPALICKKYITIHILPERCMGCTECINICPEKAIAGGEKLIHVINQEKCTHCLLCLETCQYSAIEKAGAVKPETPEIPIPVGSFESKKRNRRRRN